jgi:hypothetical protein
MLCPVTGSKTASRGCKRSLNKYPNVERIECIDPVTVTIRASEDRLGSTFAGAALLCVLCLGGFYAFYAWWLIFRSRGPLQKVCHGPARMSGHDCLPGPQTVCSDYFLHSGALGEGTIVHCSSMTRVTRHGVTLPGRVASLVRPHCGRNYAVMYLQRGPPIAENNPTTHRTHRTHRTQRRLVLDVTMCD